MTRQVFRDDLAGSRTTRQSWDQYEGHKNQPFTPAQIPAHITVHHNWNHDHKQKPFCVTPPTERHLRYTNPPWENPRKDPGYMHSNYERNNSNGPGWHHKDVRHRPFVPRANETGNVAKGTSKGYNPSRYRYVSESYLRSLKGNIASSQTSQQRNVQIAVIKPIARVETLKENELVSVCEVAPDKNNDQSDSCKIGEHSSTKNDASLAILDYEASLDIDSTNKDIEDNSNCIDIIPNSSTLLKCDSNFLNTIKDSLCDKIEPFLEDQKVYETSESKNLAIGDTGEKHLAPKISNVVKQSSEKHITETKFTFLPENSENNFDINNELKDTFVSNTNIDISANSYEEKIVHTVEPPGASSITILTNEDIEKLSSNNSTDRSKFSEDQKFSNLNSPFECCSTRTAPHRELSEEKSINIIKDSPVCLSVKPFSKNLNPESQINHRIDENSLSKISSQILDNGSSNKKCKSFNSDTLTPEMLRERLFRKFINSNEVAIPVESDVLDKRFLKEPKETIESFEPSTLKVAGTFTSKIKQPKIGKPSHPAENDHSISLIESINYDDNEQEFSKQINPNSIIESSTESCIDNSPLNLYNEKTLKILSNPSLLGNLDIHLLKDILAKIETPAEPINNTLRNTQFQLNNTNLEKEAVTKNPKMNAVNKSSINPECLKVESNKCQNTIPDKNESVVTINEEEMDTSLMLNLESVEECMLNSVSVVCLESEVWESNELRKDDDIKNDESKKEVCIKGESKNDNSIKRDESKIDSCIKSDELKKDCCIKSEECDQSHATETISINKVKTNNISKTEYELGIKCEKTLDSREKFGCILEECSINESKVRFDTKDSPVGDSSFNNFSYNNEILPNDTEEELLTIEDRLDQLFGINEENYCNMTEEKSDLNFEENNLKPIKNVEPLPSNLERSCDSLVSKNGKSSLEISNKPINDEGGCIEYDLSLKNIENEDSISTSSEEVGDGEDFFQGEENYHRWENEESKLDEGKQDKDKELEKNRKYMDTLLFEKENSDKIYNDFSVNVEKGNVDCNDKTDLFEHTTKISVPEKVYINVKTRSIERDDLPDIDKTNVEETYENNSDKEYSFVKKEISNKSAKSCNSEQIFISGKSDLQKPDILKWKVSQKRTCLFSKENLQSLQVLGSPKNVQKKCDVNYFYSDTTTTESIKYENDEDLAIQKNEILNQGNYNINNIKDNSPIKLNNIKDNSPIKLNNIKDNSPIKLNNIKDNSPIKLNNIKDNSPIKLKRLVDSDHESCPKKKQDVKPSLKCKPKDRKRKINVVPQCLSPKSLSKALETSSYMIVDEVSNNCPLGHVLEKCYTTVNVITDIISVYCKICEKTILMGKSS